MPMASLTTFLRYGANNPIDGSKYPLGHLVRKASEMQAEIQQFAGDYFQREQAIRGVAGYTPVGLRRDRTAVAALQARGIIQRPEDLGIDPRMATRDLLAAKSIKDLVRWSGGLYEPPNRFRNW